MISFQDFTYLSLRWHHSSMVHTAPFQTIICFEIKSDIRFHISDHFQWILMALFRNRYRIGSLCTYEVGIFVSILFLYVCNDPKFKDHIHIIHSVLIRFSYVEKDIRISIDSPVMTWCMVYAQKCTQFSLSFSFFSLFFVFSPHICYFQLLLCLHLSSIL